MSEFYDEMSSDISTDLDAFDDLIDNMDVEQLTSLKDGILSEDQAVLDFLDPYVSDDGGDEGWQRTRF